MMNSCPADSPPPLEPSTSSITPVTPCLLSTDSDSQLTWPGFKHWKTETSLDKAWSPQQDARLLSAAPVNKVTHSQSSSFARHLCFLRRTHSCDLDEFLELEFNLCASKNLLFEILASVTCDKFHDVRSSAVIPDVGVPDMFLALVKLLFESL